MRVGRKRTSNKGLPQCVYVKHGAYYFVDRQNKWHRLGKTEAEMHKALAALLEDTGDRFAGLCERYKSEVLPKKAPKTQEEYTRQLERLRAVFCNAPLTAIRSPHVAQYLDRHPHPVAANREIALLSTLYAHAIRWGLCEENPCTGVMRNKSASQGHYITDAQFIAAYRAAPDAIRDAMALAYYTGQRMADVVAIRRSDINTDGIQFRQAKTGKALVVEWSPHLRRAVDRALRRPRPPSVVWLLRNTRGQQLTPAAFKKSWQDFMRKFAAAGGERFQFRDIRAKARSDGPDKRLLGHANPDAMAKTYQRKPEKVSPVR